MQSIDSYGSLQSIDPLLPSLDPMVRWAAERDAKQLAAMLEMIIGPTDQTQSPVVSGIEDNLSSRAVRNASHFVPLKSGEISPIGLNAR